MTTKAPIKSFSGEEVPRGSQQLGPWILETAHQKGPGVLYPSPGTFILRHSGKHPGTSGVPASASFRRCMHIYFTLVLMASGYFSTRNGLEHFDLSLLGCKGLSSNSKEIGLSSEEQLWKTICNKCSTMFEYLSVIYHNNLNRCEICITELFTNMWAVKLV